MSTARSRPLINELLNQIEGVIVDAEAETKPLELEPFRGKLFELFVTAYANDLVEEQEGPLAADAICRELGSRWGLSESAQSSVSGGGTLPPEHIAKMRSLWSVMRMWMEWTYAWGRWDEFHSA